MVLDHDLDGRRSVSDVHVGPRTTGEFERGGQSNGRRNCSDLPKLAGGDHEAAREEYHASSDNVARLLPLVFEHTNLLCRYAFSVFGSGYSGELRPLRNPAEVLEEVPWKIRRFT
jgi:hypothetical protein